MREEMLDILDYIAESSDDEYTQWLERVHANTHQELDDDKLPF